MHPHPCAQAYTVRLWGAPACTAISVMNAGRKPDTVTATGKRRVPREEKITVMELKHMHKHTHIFIQYTADTYRHEYTNAYP